MSGKQIRTGTGYGMRVKGTKKPGCPRHDGPMRFDSTAMVWRCVEDGCGMVAFPREDVEAGKGKPRVGRGRIDLLKYGKELYLRSEQDNILLDVTKNAYIVEMVPNSRGGADFIEVTLRVEGLVELDTDG